jgi:hypothetical protein
MQPACGSLFTMNNPRNNPSPSRQPPMPLRVKIRVAIEFAWLWLSSAKFRSHPDKRRAFYEHMMVKAYRIWFC